MSTESAAMLRGFDIPSYIDIPANTYHKNVAPNNTDCTKTRFWLDSNVFKGVLLLLARETYCGRILYETPSNFCVQEDSCSQAILLPYHIASLYSYTERECRGLFKEVLEAVNVLHNVNVAHRHLNMNQIVYSRRTGKLQIGGLRYAAQMQDDMPIVAYSGPHLRWYAFRAPEAEMDGAHTTKADVWSLGVVLYMMCTGVAPFRGTKETLVENKRRGRFEFDFAAPSESCQNLVRSMLQVDPKQRPSIQQVLEHEWMTKAGSELGRNELFLARSLFQDWHHVP